MSKSKKFKPIFADDQYYQYLLRQCEEKEKHLARIQEMKMGEGGCFHYADAIKLVHEIEVLKTCRYAYTEYFTDQNPELRPTPLRTPKTTRQSRKKPRA